MKKIQIFDQSGNDHGWIGNNQSWWFDVTHPDSYEIFDLDSFYETNYFKHDHVGQDVVQNYVFYVKYFYNKICNKELNSVFEVGCAGGWFTKDLGWILCHKRNGII